MSKSLQAMNLPTRTDILELSERIGRMGETLARLEKASAAAASVDPAPASRAGRTGQPTA